MNFCASGQASSLPPEVWEMAKRDMDRALTPRTRDSLLVGISPTGSGELADSTGQIFYPASRLPDRVIWFVEEFAYGKVPPDLYYAPGHETWVATPSGGYCQMIFDDPHLNLPPREQILLKQALDAQATSKSLPEVGSRPMEPEFNISPLRRVFPVAQGMAVQTSEDSADLLSNFQIRAIRRNIIKARGIPDAEEFALEIICNCETRTMTVRSSDLDNLVPIIVKKFPACHTNEDAAKASARIGNAIRDQIPSLPTVTVVKSPGFLKLGNRWCYAHDCAQFDGPVEFRTGYTLPRDPQISPKQALQAALGVLELAPKSPTMLALLLIGHLGLLYNLFEAAGIPPQFVTLLLGQTGSFKTSTALALFRPFPELPKTPEATFRDTKTALEVKIGAACSRALIIDDFQPAVTSAAGKEILEKLELIVRLFGDGVAKSRSNSELGRAKEFHPAGCCLITGEDRGGSHSSLLRCLVLSVQKGEIWGDRLKFFQDHPEFLRTHYHHFLRWVGENGAEIIDSIRQEFQHERELFGEALQEPRQVDIAATLMLTAKILIAYAQAVMSLSKDKVTALEKQWADIIVELLLRSEEDTVELDPARMYLEALFNLHSAGRIQVAPDQASFKPGKHIGFEKNGCWWLLPHEAYANVLHYWDEQRERFPLKEGKVHALLAQSEVINTSQENRSGKIKTLYLVKSSLEGRPRMLVLCVEQARKYIEKSEN